MLTLSPTADPPPSYSEVLQAGGVIIVGGGALCQAVLEFWFTESQIIQGSTIPTFVIDRDHMVTHWNRAMEVITGVMADEIVGTCRQGIPFWGKDRPTMADVILDQYDEVQIEKLYGSKWRKSQLIDLILTDIKMPGMDGIQLLKEIRGRTDDVEVIIITGHGDIDNAIEALQYGASDFINKPIRDEALAVALYRAKEKLALKRLVEAHTDELEIEVRRATRELRRQSNFKSKLIRSSNDGIVATDADFTIVLFNPNAERIFGCAAETVVGLRKGNDFYPARIDDVFQSDLRQHETRKELPWRETTIVAQDGRRIPVRFSATLLYEEAEMMGSVAFFQDLREIKRLEHELVQSERLAAMGQTVAGLAHGVKNVLQGFKGGSYLVDIGIEKQDTEKLKKGWAMIQRNIGSTSDLVLDLLSYSKQREPELGACEPNVIVVDIAELMEGKAHSHDIALVTDLDPCMGAVVMDSHTLHHSLLNLVTNALDA